MKTTPFLFLLILSTGCANLQKTTASDLKSIPLDVTGTPLPLKPVRNYFVKNDVVISKDTCFIINSSEQFSKVAGTATTMDELGKPTRVDFSKQIVLMIIGTETEFYTEYKIQKLEYLRGQLVCAYTKEEGIRLSYAIRPHMAVMIDKEYEAPLKVIAR